MATMTITTTASESARVAAAFGSLLSLNRDATAAEVKAAVIDFIKSIVREQERAEAIKAITFTPMDPT